MIMWKNENMMLNWKDLGLGFRSPLHCIVHFSTSEPSLYLHEMSINSSYYTGEEAEVGRGFREERTILPFGKFSNFFVHVIFGLGLPVEEIDK